MGISCQGGILANVGDPPGSRVMTRNRATVHWPGRESERGVVLVKTGNSGGGKCPYFWHSSEG